MNTNETKTNERLLGVEDGGQGFCDACGTKIRWHHHVENLDTNAQRVLGSECVAKALRPAAKVALAITKTKVDLVGKVQKFLASHDRAKVVDFVKRLHIWTVNNHFGLDTAEEFITHVENL